MIMYSREKNETTPSANALGAWIENFKITYLKILKSCLLSNVQIDVALGFQKSY